MNLLVYPSLYLLPFMSGCSGYGFLQSEIHWKVGLVIVAKRCGYPASSCNLDPKPSRPDPYLFAAVGNAILQAVHLPRAGLGLVFRGYENQRGRHCRHCTMCISSTFVTPNSRCTVCCDLTCPMYHRSGIWASGKGEQA